MKNGDQPKRHKRSKYVNNMHIIVIQVTLKCKEFNYQDTYIDPLEYSDGYDQEYSKEFINSGNENENKYNRNISDDVNYNNEYISRHSNDNNKNEEEISTVFDNNSRYKDNDDSYNNSNYSTYDNERTTYKDSMNEIQSASSESTNLRPNSSGYSGHGDDEIKSMEDNDENDSGHRDLNTDDNQSEDLWASSHTKIFIENIPEDITVDSLTYAMRNCGDVADVMLLKNRSYGEEDPRKVSSDSSSIWLEQYGNDSFSSSKPLRYSFIKFILNYICIFFRILMSYFWLVRCFFCMISFVVIHMLLPILINIIIIIMKGSPDDQRSLIQ